MPELPDILVYVERLRAFALGRTLLGASVSQPFVLRSVVPPLDSVRGKRVCAVTHIAKQIVLGLDDELALVTANKAANQILKAVRKDKMRVVIGADAKLFESAKRAMPDQIHKMFLLVPR